MLNKSDITNLRKRFYNIKSRCYNKKTHVYMYYGARGIKVCDEWLNDINKFIDWSIKNGFKRELTIDRIDVNGNYEPSNCRWVSYQEQAKNKRKNAIRDTNREAHSIVEEIAIETNRSVQIIYKLAKKLGRIPTKEEVLNRKNGRPSIFNSKGELIYGN